MTGDTSAPEEPIDAEFEPATPEPSTPDRQSSGPGWLGVGVASFAAACIGGLIGVFASGPNSSGQTDELQGEIDQLATAQRAIESNVSTLETAVETTSETLQREVQALVSGDGETAGLDALVDDLEAISARLDETGDTGTLPDLVARLEALEQADENEAVSPRQMNRAVTAMRERVDTLEDSLAAIRRGLDVRAEAMAALTTRIASLETDGVSVPEDLSNAIDTLQQQVASMRADIASVESVAANSDAVEDATEAAAEAEAERERAVADAAVQMRAALAFAEIRGRANRGEGFESQLDTVRVALPDHPAVARLEPFSGGGTPGLTALKTRFESARLTAETVVEEEAPASDGWGWVRRAFGGAVTVRRDGEGADALGATLDEASAALDSGDIGLAITRLETLENASSGAFKDWLDDARMRRDLEAALDSLNDAMRRAEP